MRPLILSIFLQLCLLANGAFAEGLKCSLALQLPPSDLKLSSNPIKQWLQWEQLDNIVNFRQPTESIKLKYSLIPSDLTRAAIHKDAPADLRNLLQTGKLVRWFKHPFNTDPKVPYFHDLEVGTLKGYYTASRSIFFLIGKNPFSIKLPSDHPHGADRKVQLTKSSVNEDLKNALARIRHIEKVQRQIGADPEFEFAKEIVLVQDQITNEGFLIRDLGFLNDGHYYLPAFSIPYAGEGIARHHGFEPQDFWRTHYAEKIGRIKAKLLLHYGMQMDTPNSQNFLIQLDKDMNPTGKIIIRDVGDIQLVRPIALALGFTKQVQEDYDRGAENTNRIRPFASNTFWLMDKSQNPKITKHLLMSDWIFAHNHAYTEYLSKSLGIDFNRFPFIDLEPEFEAVLDEKRTQVLLRDFHYKLRK